MRGIAIAYLADNCKDKYLRGRELVDTTEKMPKIVNTMCPKSGLQFSYTQQKITVTNDKDRIAKETKRGWVDFNRNSTVRQGTTCKDCLWGG